MKKPSISSLLFLASLGGLVWYIAAHPPGGAPWEMFWFDSASLAAKISALAAIYLVPGLLASFSIGMFQIQFRIAATGANKRLLFSLCMLASAAMLVSLRSVSTSPTSAPSYVVGMALGYTVTSRLYAVRMRTFFGRLRLPWPVWRGNLQAVRDVDHAMQSCRTKAG